MQATLQKEGEQDQEIYEKLACWCMRLADSKFQEVYPRPINNIASYLVFLICFSRKRIEIHCPPIFIILLILQDSGHLARCIDFQHHFSLIARSMILRLSLSIHASSSSSINAQPRRCEGNDKEKTAAIATAEKAAPCAEKRLAA